MIGRVLFSLSALALIAAQPAPAPVAKPAMLSVIAPQDIAADPSNKLTIELSSGGSVVIGFDVMVLDQEGRILDVRGFLDRIPQ